MTMVVVVYEYMNRGVKGRVCVKREEVREESKEIAQRARERATERGSAAWAWEPLVAYPPRRRPLSNGDVLQSLFVVLLLFVA